MFYQYNIYLHTINNILASLFVLCVSQGDGHFETQLTGSVCLHPHKSQHSFSHLSPPCPRSKSTVPSAIKSCKNSRAYGPDSPSIFHMKNLGHLATKYPTTLYNDSLKSYRLPSLWKTSLVIPIPKPGKDSSQGTSYRPISLLCPAAKVLDALILPSINEFI